MSSPFGAFVKKEVLHILRDRRTMLILLGMPIIQILLFGFAISTEIRNVNVAVLDPSNDQLTRGIIERFASSNYFTLVQQVGSSEELDRGFRSGTIDMALVFPSQLERELRHSGQGSVQIIADAADPNNANMMANYAMGVVQTAVSETMKRTGGSPTAQIVPQLHMLYNPQMKAAYNFVPGVMGLVLMLICAMMTSFSVVREKERGTMEVLLVSPIQPMMVLIAKIVPYFLLSCINMATLLLLSVYVLDVPIAGSLLSLTFVSMLFILVNLGLGVLVSSVVSTQVAAMMFSGLVLMMPTMLLSGMVFPLDSMPSILQYLSVIIPARWYISSVKKIMIEGASIVHAAVEIGVLCGMAVLLLVVSFKKFKKRLE